MKITHKSPTRLSIALEKMQKNIKDKCNEAKKTNQPEFTIKIANSLEERDAVFSLGYQIYLEKGYVKPNTQNWLIFPYDKSPQTIILIVQDKEKNIAGSATLVFDGSSKLPAEAVYKEEIHSLNMQNKKTAELCRLVINPHYRNVKEILILLFNYAAIYIHHVRQYHGLAIEVNPRHKTFYKTMLHFEELGATKCCPQVENAAGVLLYLSVTKYQSIIRGSFDSINKKERSLYNQFINAEQENLVAFYLAKQTRPLSNEELIHFGFKDTNSGITACV